MTIDPKEIPTKCELSIFKKSITSTMSSAMALKVYCCLNAYFNWSFEFP
jgi:hypothetical protein